MNIVLQNLTRFGDLLQSQPAVSELAAAGNVVSLACLENFAGAAGLLADISEVFPLPGSKFLAGLDADWKLALATIADFADVVEDRARPDCVVNLTAALSARLLARRLCGEAVRGFSLDPFGYRHESNLWASFLEASSTRRELCPFNIVDVFRKAAGVGQGPGRFALRRPDAAAAEEAAALFAGAGPGDDLLVVGFQLGASAAARQWPVERFARLAARLHEKRGILAVVVGAASEKPLAARFCELFDGPSLDLSGATSLPTLAAVVARLGLLVTNDTGTLHLAAGLGVPSVALFLATAQPFDTGPYLEGCLCLEPDMPCHPCSFQQACPRSHACLDAIDPEAVAEAVLAWRRHGRFPLGDYPGARAWLSARGAEGFMDLVSLSGHEATPRAVWLRCQRHVLRQFLDDAPHVPPTAPLPPLPEAERQELLRLLSQSADLLRLVEGQAGLARRSPAMKNRFLTSYNRVTALWSASPYLATLAQLWQRQAQEEAVDIDGLVARIRRYGACTAAFAAILQD